MYGARIPAVYLMPGSTRLRICYYVNHNKNHCHGTDSMGYDWFNLKIGQHKENDKYMYEIRINDRLEYSIENKAYTWNEVRVEFANRMPHTAEGEFKNFQLSTIRPERPDEPIQEYIYNLIEKFEEVIYNSDMRLGQKDRWSRNFEFYAEYLPSQYKHLLEDECTDFPDTFEDDGEPDEAESCQAIDQIISRASQWSETFLYSCRLANRGKDPLKFHKRNMARLNKIGDKAKEKLNC